MPGRDVKTQIGWDGSNFPFGFAASDAWYVCRRKAGILKSFYEKAGRSQ